MPEIRVLHSLPGIGCRSWPINWSFPAVRRHSRVCVCVCTWSTWSAECNLGSGTVASAARQPGTGCRSRPINRFILPRLLGGTLVCVCVCALGALGVRNATSVPGRLPPPPVSHGAVVNVVRVRVLKCAQMVRSSQELVCDGRSSAALRAHDPSSATWSARRPPRRSISAALSGRARR